MSPIPKTAKAGLARMAKVKPTTKQPMIKTRFMFCSLLRRGSCLALLHRLVRGGLRAGSSRPIVRPVSQEAQSQIEDRDQAHQEEHPNAAKHVPIKPHKHRFLLRNPSECDAAHTRARANRPTSTPSRDALRGSSWSAERSD